MNEIQKIKQEIERLKEHTAKCGYPGQGEFENGNREGRNWVCDKLLSFIDSLPEEPKCIYNRTLDERKKFCKYCSAAFDVRIEEEHASKDLEEAAQDYTEKSYQCQDEMDAFIAGAEWQKQQMIKDAVEGEVYKGYAGKQIVISSKDGNAKYVAFDRSYANVFNIGDKVKIIICKIEQQ